MARFGSPNVKVTVATALLDDVPPAPSPVSSSIFASQSSSDHFGSSGSSTLGKSAARRSRYSRQPVETSGFGTNRFTPMRPPTDDSRFGKPGAGRREGEPS